MRPKYISEGFAERFLIARTDAGLSQKDVADLTRPTPDEPPLVSVRTISDWENGASYPQLGEGIRVVGKILNVELRWLWRGVGP